MKAWCREIAHDFLYFNACYSISKIFEMSKRPYLTYIGIADTFIYYMLDGAYIEH